MKIKILLTVIVISASLLLIRKRKDVALVTHKVFLRDGSEGRAVKLTAQNNIKVLNWIPGAQYRELVAAKTGQASSQRILLFINNSKVSRVAYYDDWILKTDKGFSVVKFDKVENTLFFPNAFEPAHVQRELNKWVRLNG